MKATTELQWPNLAKDKGKALLPLSAEDLRRPRFMVENFPPDTSWEEIKSLFCPKFGDVVEYQTEFTPEYACVVKFTEYVMVHV